MHDKLPVKICGLTRKCDIDASIAGGASMLGFVFYPPSKRSLTAKAWADLAKHVDGRAPKVGVFVNPDDAWLEEVNQAYPLDFIQLHGTETPKRVAEVKKMGILPIFKDGQTRSELKVIKALSISDSSDLDKAWPYQDVADMLLFDAKPPKVAGAIPGGNGLSFDWRLLADAQFDLPWLLAGGISAANLNSAIQLTGAPMADVSSGVEDAPGIKNKDQIKQLLDLAKTMGKAQHGVN